MLGLKLNHVSKRGHRCRRSLPVVKSVKMDAILKILTCADGEINERSFSNPHAWYASMVCDKDSRNGSGAQTHRYSPAISLVAANVIPALTDVSVYAGTYT